MSTSKIYKFCNGSNVETNTTITLSTSGSGWRSWTYSYGFTTIDYTESTSLITITATTAPTTDLLINYTYHVYEVKNYYGGTTIYDEIESDTVILPAGETTITKEYVSERTERLRDSQDGRMDEDSVLTRDDVIVVNQVTLPTCGGQPVGCTLEITGNTITPPTQRGLTNGTISLGITGASGSTSNLTYNLNGNTITSSGATSGYTFVNLAAGVYTVYVSQGDCWDQIVGLVVPEGEFRTGDFFIPVTLPDVVAANNPIIVNVNTKVKSTVGLTHKSVISIGATIANNTSVNVNLTSPFNYTQTYFAKHYPNKTNYFLASTLTNSIGIPVGTNDAIEIATSLSQVLNNDAVLPTIYYIESIGTDVFITARETGSRFNLTLNNNIVISGSNVTFSIIQNGTDQYDGQLTDNYSIYAEVYADTSGKQYPEVGTNIDYNKIGELIIPFNKTNQHKFNLSEMASSLVDTPRPNNLSEVYILPETMKSYYCKLGEIYPLIANTNTLKKRYKSEIPKFWVINSSLEREVYNDMDTYVGNAFSLDGIDSRQSVEFLTKSPSSHYITKDSEQYLYFILPKDYKNLLHLNATIHYNDGSIDYNQNVLNITTLATNAGGVCLINVSFSNLGLASYEVDKKIDWYSLGVKQVSCTLGSIVDFSNLKTYYVNEHSYPDMYGVNFQNSLGMYDTFDFIGEVQNTIDIETLTYTKPLSYNNYGAVAEGFKSKAIYSNKVTNKIVVNSGWIDKSHFDWLLELMNSKNIYSYTTPYANYLMIQDFEYARSTNEDLYNIKITFIETMEENSISI